MLEKQDLQAIQTMIDTSVSASEERMSAKMDAAISASEDRMSAKMDSLEDRMTKRIDEAVSASEERMSAKMDSLEDRMTKRIDEAVSASENRLLAYIENAVMPNFKLLAEGQQTILETMARKDRVEALEDEVVFLKSVVSNLVQDVAELKKAQ